MEKSADAFRTISEVSELLQTPAHVLRFWESRFSQVKPVKRAGGRRYYRPADLALLGGIKRLLHDDGMTIRGVQKVLREHGVRHVASLSSVDLGTPASPGDTKPDAPLRAEEPLTLVPQSREKSAGSESGLTAAANVTPLWPDASTPDVAAAGDRLMPDPDDDLSSPIADEAPMELDAEPAPDSDPATVHAFGGESTGPEQRDTPPPAATLLRAMDALRARDQRSELTSVYQRLKGLRDRVARNDGGRD